MRTGHVEWFVIRTSRPDVAVSFYTELFGWRFQAFAPPGGPAGWTVWHGDREIGMLTTAPDTGPPPPPAAASTVLYVFVEDLERAVDLAVALGARVSSPPVFIDDETGANAELIDPTGVVIGVWALSLDAAVAEPAVR